MILGLDGEIGGTLESAGAGEAVLDCMTLGSMILFTAGEGHLALLAGGGIALGVGD